jgi:cytochrome c-type biogenesis protein CcmH
MVERLLALAALCLTLAAPVAAQQAASAPRPSASTSPEDASIELRMLQIAAELRCLVCQNQTIADSNASLAVDLRRQLTELLRAGKSREEIVQYMTARYGDFVLYRPPLKESTALLWFGPALLFFGALAVLVVVLRRRSRIPADRFEPDPEEEKAR